VKESCHRRPPDFLFLSVISSAGVCGQGRSYAVLGHAGFHAPSTCFGRGTGVCVLMRKWWNMGLLRSHKSRKKRALLRHHNSENADFLICSVAVKLTYICTSTVRQPGGGIFECRLRLMQPTLPPPPLLPPRAHPASCSPAPHKQV
jgi:hypothetical protein